MGLYLADGKLYGNNKSPQAVAPYNIIIDQSVWKLEIDINKILVSW